ncbi:bifunctional glycosyltransferase/CDP-glycerol:glycerophosphate glycerophosphotransferase [Streptomyces sp. NRRL F-5123]|uniref:bifunctional glycosyltransferase/CDP-glycerol:glycerophosphate glycerophosphotransferase n=1 Tax=Streptomyces sp. NRRL F-5123 TaxID=1463856 RepID=UPI0004E1BB28|nr:CDP-glycerol glycerophosphotransferase family protein [Streptomyces sp. NRRL F-5123]
MTPRLTVVVPVYNVEQYLEECLRSIAAQTLADLDVVMVDDGSTDASADIARAFAARDSRFRLVSQDNGGLGHARNTGARHAAPETEYLTFADSDDVLPPHAYGRLTALLDRSGSDFATGNVYRLTPAGRSQAWQHRGMTKTVSRTHITRDLGLLSDRVAWNKVFRRDFWNRHRLAFPEGVLYEDTPVTIPAHFLAEAVDVSHEHVYYWRIREGSITRRRTDVKGVTDRIAAVDGVSRFLADPANTRWSRYKRDYDRSVLTDDLLYFIEALPMAGPDYRRVFMDRAADYLSRVDPGLLPGLPVELRLRWELIREGRIDDLLDVLAHERHGGRTVFDLAGPPLRKRAALPRPDGTPVPLSRSATAVGRSDLPVVARLRDLRWRDGKLVLSGYAYVRNADARSRRAQFTTAVATCGRRRLLLPLRAVRVPDVTDEQRQERHCYDWSGFEITVDPARLREQGQWKPGQWRIGVVVAGSAGVRPAAVRAAETGAGSSPVPFPLTDDIRLVPWYKDGRLHLSVEPVTRRLTGHRAGDDGTTLRLALDVRDGRLPLSLRLAQQAGGSVLDVRLEPGEPSGGWTPLTAEVPLPRLGRARPDLTGLPKEVAPETTATWTADLVFPNGGTARVALDRPLPPGHYPLPADERGAGRPVPRELSVESTAAGNLVLRDRIPHALADHLTLTPDGLLRIEGELPTPLLLPEPPAPREDAAAGAEGGEPGRTDEGTEADGGDPGGTDEAAGTEAAEPGHTEAGEAEPGRTEVAAGAEAAEPEHTEAGEAEPGRTDEGTGGGDGSGAPESPDSAARPDDVAATAEPAPGPAPEPGAEADPGAEPERGAEPGENADPLAGGGVRLMLRHGTYGAETGVGVEREPGGGARFSASVDVGALPHAGRWYLHLRADGRDTPVRIAPAAMPALPLALPEAEGARPLTVDRRFHDHLFVAAGDPVPAEDRGPYRQRLLRERRYPVLMRRELTETVLYSSFDGRRCDDSPRAVHGELVRRGVAMEHVWAVADRNVPVPAAARAVVIGSHAWYEALARSRCVVTNTHLPAFFRRRDDQHVVQTWHGSPVKRFGQDLAGTLCADLTHMWPQPRRGDQWSLLLSPNAQSTPVLRRALDFHGETAETGLPRADLLSGEDREKVAEEVRARLALPPGRTVVLYAPTVRDDEAYDAGHQRLHLAADLAALEAELGDTHVLLVRAHPRVADTVPAAPDGKGFVRDVSGHQDLAELLLAADVLVTDYASLIADFAVTGRPILLLAPDLAHVRDTLRGFAFDFEAQAPGPLLPDTAELIAALRDPAAAVGPFGAAYDAFRAAFCHLDDGNAAARVADLILRGPRI